MIEPAAAELCRDVRGVEAQVQHLLPDLPADLVRHDAGALDLRLERVELPLDEAAHGVDHHPLLFGETEIHVLIPIRGAADVCPG